MQNRGFFQRFWPFSRTPSGRASVTADRAWAPSLGEAESGFDEEAPQAILEELETHSVAAEVVQETTARVLRERIDLLGVVRSGAYDHYKLLLSRGFPIPPYALAILDLVRRRLSGLNSYHEIGSGLGTLPLMLAHDGFPALGVERDEARHLTAMAILSDLAARAPNVEENCRLIGAAFPDAVADIDVSGSMAILTDFVATHSEGELVRLCRGLARYRYVLVDLQRFCQKRESPEEQQELIEHLAGYGLSLCPGAMDFGSEGYYRLFVGKSYKDRHNMVIERPRLSLKPTPAEAAAQELTEVSREELPARPVVGKPPAQPAPILLPPRPRRARGKRFGGMLGLSALLMIGLPTLIGGGYYGYWAANQYVTTFEFAVRSPGHGHSGSLADLMGAGGGMVSPDAFVVSDFIESHQAVEDVGRDLDLRKIFSRPVADFWTRLDPKVSPEGLDAYWKRMVDSHFDMITGNVYVSVRAFTPGDSLKLADAIIKESNGMFNKLNNRAQHDFVKVADDDLKDSEQQLSAARTALVAFQEKLGVLDPKNAAHSTSSMIDGLRQNLGQLTAQYEATRATAPRSPLLAVLRSQIAAIRHQIRRAAHSRSTTAARVMTPADMARYEALETQRQFAQNLYADALKLRQNAYIAAHEQQSYLALFVSPGLPHASLYPDRPKAIAIIVLTAAAVWFLSVMIGYAIRDHLMI